MQHMKAPNGVEWLEFDLLADIPHVKHGVFLRAGGQSTGCFSSLNVSFDVGDDPEHVQANLDLVFQALRGGTSLHSLKWAKQQHDVGIAFITSSSPQETPHCDALLTDEKDIALLIKHADCQAALFYDPIHHAIANVHAGWRGNIANIYQKTIEAMNSRFGSKPSELLVCISPSLGPDDAEFIHYQFEFPPEFWQFQIKPYYFDLWSMSEMQLQEAGILPHHIEIARISTLSNPHDYFSYRRQHPTGRHGTCIALT